MFSESDKYIFTIPSDFYRGRLRSTMMSFVKECICVVMRKYACDYLVQWSLLIARDHRFGETRVQFDANVLSVH